MKSVSCLEFGRKDGEQISIGEAVILWLCPYLWVRVKEVVLIRVIEQAYYAIPLLDEQSGTPILH